MVTKCYRAPKKSIAMCPLLPLGLRSCRRQQQQIRVTEEQAKRLRRVAKSQGLTVQAFALRAIMSAVAEAEEELREGKAQRRRVAQEETATLLSPPALENEPQGLGVRSRRERREAEKAERAAASILPAPTVVIQNGSVAGPSPHEATIAKLASHIAAAPKWQRDMHMRGAVSTLQMLADSDEERAVLAKRLDDLIAVEDGKRGAESNTKSVLGQLKGLFDLKM